jgi:hypothetical protein
MHVVSLTYHTPDNPSCPLTLSAVTICSSFESGSTEHADPARNTNAIKCLGEHFIVVGGYEVRRELGLEKSSRLSRTCRTSVVDCRSTVNEDYDRQL